MSIKALKSLTPFNQKSSIVRLKTINENTKLLFMSDKEILSDFLEVNDITSNTIPYYTKPKRLKYASLVYVSKEYQNEMKSTSSKLGIRPVLIPKKGFNNIIDFTEFTSLLSSKFPSRLKKLDLFSNFFKDLESNYFDKTDRNATICLFIVNSEVKFLDSLVNSYVTGILNGTVKPVTTLLLVKDITGELKVVKILDQTDEKTDIVNLARIRTTYNSMEKIATTKLQREQTEEEVTTDKKDDDKDATKKEAETLKLQPFEQELVNKAIDDGLIVKDDLIKKDKTILKSIINATSDTNTTDDLRTYDKALYQKKIDEKIRNKSPRELITDAQSTTIEKEILIDNSDDKLKTVTMTSNVLREQYRSNLLDKDLKKVAESFSEHPDMPLFLEGVEEESFDDGLNKFTAKTFKFKTLEGRELDIKVNIPDLQENKFYVIDGTRYIMYNQLVSKPILKIKPDTVAITTSYNKSFIYRFGADSKNSKHNKLTKYLLKEGSSKVSRRKDTSEVLPYKNLTFDLEHVIKYFDVINLSSGTVLTFTKDTYEVINDSFEVIGTTKNNLKVLLDSDGSISYLHHDGFIETSGIHTVDYIINGVKPDLFKTKNKSLYSRINIIGKKLPLILVLLTIKSLKDIMKMYKTQYVIVPLKERITENDSTLVIPLSNVKLVIYTETIEQQLLFNALKSLSKTSKDNSIENLFNTSNNFIVQDNLNTPVINGLRNSLNKLIDPITKELLEKDLLPTNIIEVLLYANTMLSDSSYKKPSDFNNYRVRNEETFAAIIYRELSNEINKQANLYKRNKKSYKLNVNPNFLKTIMINELPNVAPLSSSNPFYELDETNKITFSGFLGLNSSRSAEMNLRLPDVTQKGIVDTNSITDNASVGLIKYGTLNTNYTSLRGNIAPITDEEFKKDPSRGLSVNSSLDVGVAASADASRVAMANIQARHLMPVDGMYSKPIIRTGAEDVVKHKLSSDWVIKSPVDGTITSIDDKKKIITLDNKVNIPYKDKILRNSGAGFYHQHSFSIDKNLKVGSKIIANKTPLAYNDGVFKDGTLAVVGRYLNVCLVPTGELIEDAGLVSSTIASQMVMKYVLEKEIIVNEHEYLHDVVKIGDKIKAGDTIARMKTSAPDDFKGSTLFDDFDDIYNEVKSKISGEVVDIKVYYNRNEEDLSDANKELIVSLSKLDKDEKDSSNRHVYYVSEDRILGRKLKNSVIIKVYIRADKKGSTGSKMTMQSTKSVYTVKDTLLMPKTVEGTEIDVLISSLSLVTRMTPTNIIHGYLAKIVHRTIEKIKKEKDINKVRSEITTLLTSIYKDNEDKDILNSELTRFNTLTDKKLRDMINDDDFYINVKPFREPSLTRLKEVSEILDIPLEEYVYFPDKNNMMSEKPVPVLYVPIKFLNQIADKGVAQSHKVDEVNVETGQLTQTAKIRQFSVDESLHLFSYGLEDTVLPELTLYRSDDREAFNSMERAIIENGSVSIDDISTKGQAQTANTLGAYLIAAGYDNNIRQEVNIKVDGKSVDTRS